MIDILQLVVLKYELHIALPLIVACLILWKLSKQNDTLQKQFALLSQATELTLKNYGQRIGSIEEDVNSLFEKHEHMAIEVTKLTEKFKRD